MKSWEGRRVTKPCNVQQRAQEEARRIMGRFQPAAVTDRAFGQLGHTFASTTVAGHSGGKDSDCSPSGVADSSEQICSKCVCQRLRRRSRHPSLFATIWMLSSFPSIRMKLHILAFRLAAGAAVSDDEEACDDELTSSDDQFDLFMPPKEEGGPAMRGNSVEPE